MESRRSYEMLIVDDDSPTHGCASASWHDIPPADCADRRRDLSLVF